MKVLGKSPYMTLNAIYKRNNFFPEGKKRYLTISLVRISLITVLFILLPLLATWVFLDVINKEPSLNSIPIPNLWREKFCKLLTRIQATATNTLFKQAGLKLKYFEGVERSQRLHAKKGGSGKPRPKEVYTVPCWGNWKQSMFVTTESPTPSPTYRYPPPEKNLSTNFLPSTSCNSIYYEVAWSRA